MRSRVSLFDVQEWIDELKKRKILEFEYRELPEDLQTRSFIHKAKEVGLLRSIEKENGRNKWRITEGVRPK